MSASVERSFTDAVEWAHAELSRADFAEIRLAFIVHAGRLTRIEKSITLKEQPVGEAVAPWETNRPSSRLGAHRD